MDMDKIRNTHKILKEFDYTVKELEKGYADRVLYVNVSDLTIKAKEVPQQMKEKFIGGKGYGLRLLWDAVTPETKWDSPENEIIIGTGPICGITEYPGAGKSLLCTISPLTDMVIDSNVGGHVGPYIKFSGWDALEIQGKAEEDVLIFVDGDNGKVWIEKAPTATKHAHLLIEELSEMYIEDPKQRKGFVVACTGPGAEHARMGMLNFSFYDGKRKVYRVKQAGRGGIGTVLRNKKVRAVCIKYTGSIKNKNNVADMDLLRKAGRRINKEIMQYDDKQNNMRKIGTANIIEVMDAYDLLPTI